MDLDETLLPLLDALVAAFEQEQPALYEAGREMAVRLWAAFREKTAGGVESVAELPDPTGDGPLAGLWQGIAGPFAQGLSDELEGRIKSLVAPTVQKAALAAGGAGIVAGWTAANWLKKD